MTSHDEHGEIREETTPDTTDDVLYDDDTMTIDETGITIKGFMTPKRDKRIEFEAVLSVELMQITAMTGRYQLVGMPLLRPRNFYAFNRARSKKNEAISINTGGVLYPTVTPDDPARVHQLVTERIAG